MTSYCSRFFIVDINKRKTGLLYSCIETEYGNIADYSRYNPLFSKCKAIKYSILTTD